MPRAKIAIDDGEKPSTILNRLVKEGVCQRISVGGVKVYARPYLSRKQIVNAYKRRVTSASE